MVDQYLETYTRIAAPRIARGAPRLRTEILRAPGVLRDLEPEWTRLFAQCPAATPFSSPDWLMPWWDAFGGAPLEIVTIRLQGELVGLLPLYRYKGRQYAIGHGITDYLDCLARPDVASAAAQEIWCCLGPCDIPDVSPDSPLIRFAPVSRRANISESSTCFVLDLHEIRWPRKLLYNLRIGHRNLQRLGSVAVEEVQPEPLSVFLDVLFELHTARWATRGEAGMLSQPSLQNFHRTAADRLWCARMLRLFALHVNGEMRAVLYCLTRGGRTYNYLGGFDPALAAFGIGALLLHHAIGAAAATGDAEFDFLRGDEPYKTRWGAKPRTSARILIGDPAEQRS